MQGMQLQEKEQKVKNMGKLFKKNRDETGLLTLYLKPFRS